MSNLREKINEFNAISRGFRAALELSEAIEEFLNDEAELGSHHAAIAQAKADIAWFESERAGVIADLTQTQDELASAREQLAEVKGEVSVIADKIVQDASAKAEQMIAQTAREADEVLARSQKAADDLIAKTQEDLTAMTEVVAGLRHTRADLNTQIQILKDTLAETQTEIEANNRRIAAFIEASKL